MSNTFHMKRGDRLPAYTATLKDANGAVDLTGATSAKFIMREQHTQAPKVNATCQITNASQGQIKYEWGATDTDTPGTYLVEIEVDFGGKKMTFPNPGYNIVLIGEDLD